MSYTIKDLEMIQDFIIRNEENLKASYKYDTLDKLQKEMERDILYTRYIESQMPRVFIASNEDEVKFAEEGMTTGMVALLVDKNETVDIQGIKSSKTRATAMVINGVGLNQIQAELLGELLVFNDLMKLDSSKDILDLALKYRNKKTDYKPTEVISTRPAPKPTVEKEVIDSKTVEEALSKPKEEGTHVDEMFTEIFGEKDENGNYAEFNKFEEDLKKAHNLLGTPNAETVVEEQVEKAKETSMFGDKPFVFKAQEDTDKDSVKPALKKAGTKGAKPKFTGFVGTEFTAEDGLVNEEGIPLKFANNKAAEEKFGELSKDGKMSTNIADLVSPETLKVFTQGTHDATEEELKVINADDTQPTIFGKPRIDGEYVAPIVIPNLENIYFVDDDGDLAGIARDKETEEYIRKNFDELKAQGNYIVIQNGSLRKLDGSANFTLDEREFLIEQFRNIITDPNVDNLGIPQDVLDVMEVEVEDWDNNMETEDID